MATADMKLMMVLQGKDGGALRLIRETEAHLKRFGSPLRALHKDNLALSRIGIRSQKQIQNEIRQTQAAYNRLARSGKLSGNDLQRAAVATRNRIRELNNELNHGVGLQAKLGKGMAIGGAMLAGGAAAYGVLKPSMDNAKQLDANITQVAWQAYGEDNTKSADWIATQGKENIKTLALELVNQNGGTADAALNLINSMMANGMSFQETQAAAKSSHKAMIVSAENVGDYQPQETAKLMKVLSDFGFKGQDLGKAFEYAMKSGMQGNFEIADMVNELPALLPAAKSAGFDGLQDFGYLLSMLQSAANKAGSNSEAANNVRNTLAKTLSADTVKRLSKSTNPNDPPKGIDWEGSVLKGRERGENAVQVLSRLVNKVLETDAQFQEYKKKADAGDSAAQQQMNIMRGFVMSKIMPDLQARDGLLAASDKAQVDEYMRGLAGLDKGKELSDRKLKVLQDSAAFKQEKAEAQTALKQDVSTFVEAETALKQMSAEYPNATLAVKTLAAAATAAAGALSLMSLANVGGKVGAGGMLARVGSMGAAALPAAGAIVGGGFLVDSHSRINQNENKGFFEGGLNSRGAGYAESALGGAALGAAIGSIVPVLGTAVGAAAGGVIGLIHAAITDAVTENPSVNNTPTINTPTPLQPDEPPEKLSPIIMQQTQEYTAAVQNNATTVGEKIDQVSSALANVNHNINNNITVSLDGRVIANEVSRHQFSMLNRGAGQ